MPAAFRYNRAACKVVSRTDRLGTYLAVRRIGLTGTLKLSLLPRVAEVARTTRETDIRLRLDLDGEGLAGVATGIGFLDHMLELFARHSLMDLSTILHRRSAR